MQMIKRTDVLVFFTSNESLQYYGDYNLIFSESLIIATIFYKIFVVKNS
jgi:hypothetical protein